jgi:hypothetical protein
MNWLVSAAAVNVLDNVVVLALDKPVHDMLAERGFPSFYDPATYQTAAAAFTGPSDQGHVWNECCLKLVPAPVGGIAKFLRRRKDADRTPMHACCKRKYVWAQRLSAVRTLLMEGITVIQSDTDALLLKNPITSLAPYSGDLLAQRGSFPKEIAERWGATMSFGFIRYRPTLAVLAFIELGHKLFAKEGDDQRDLQTVLNGCTNFAWNLEGTGAAPLPPAPLKKEEVAAVGLGVADFGVSISPLTEGGDRLKIVLLPNRAVPRRCGESTAVGTMLVDHAIAAHCYKRKKMHIREAEFYFLKPHWSEPKIVPEETATQFFIRIGIGHPAMAVGG